MLDYKDIHLGNHIKEVAKIKNLSVSRACAFLKCSAQDIQVMYNQKTLDSGLLLRWCKLLDYNFFMFYHSHLQLYKPSAATTRIEKTDQVNCASDYAFKKNLYSPDLIDYILRKLDNKDLSIGEVIQMYNIPRTTVYRWVKKRKADTDLYSENRSVVKKKVNYKNLYTDFLSECTSLDPMIKSVLRAKIKELASSEITYKYINEVNMIIKKFNKRRYDETDYQNLKTYDKAQVISILKEQREDGLSNREISSKYKMSRTTIARWRSMYKVEL